MHPGQQKILTVFLTVVLEPEKATRKTTVRLKR
jgi:hypothetical protein